jgi:hypothetical protein
MPKRHHEYSNDLEELMLLLDYAAYNGQLSHVLLAMIIRNNYLSNFHKKPIVITSSDWLEVAKILED